jgi:hypothetical protein
VAEDDLPVSVDRLLAYLGSEYVHRKELEGLIAELQSEIIEIRQYVESLEKTEISRSN